MICIPRGESAPSWHARFLDMLPAIERQGRIDFRGCSRYRGHRKPSRWSRSNCPRPARRWTGWNLPVARMAQRMVPCGPGKDYD